MSSNLTGPSISLVANLVNFYNPKVYPVIMETKTWWAVGWSSLLGILVIIALSAVAWNGCMGAATGEIQYNNQIQPVARRWVEASPQMQLIPSSVMCIPRAFNSRMPEDMTHCCALTTGNYRGPLLCNMQGCTIDHSLYNF